MNTEKEQAYWEDWDEAALRGIIQRQRKIIETSKKLEMKKLYQVLIILADMPQLHKATGALDTLFIRGRHMQISTWVSSQKLRLISAGARVNQQFLCCWRLRNQHELDAVIEELSAQATRDPYSFLFVYYLKPKNETFYLRFEERFALEREADGSGAQLPGPEAVREFHTDLYEMRERFLLHLRRSPVPHHPSNWWPKEKDDHYLRGLAGSDSDFEVDLGESLHWPSIRSESPTASSRRIAAATCTGWTPRLAR